MVSFPGLKKDLCGALKKAIGMECRGRHIPAVPQWLGVMFAVMSCANISTCLALDKILHEQNIS